MKPLRELWGRVLALACAAGIVGGLAACGLDGVDVPEGFEGPAELAESLFISATPDILPADGNSTSVVRAVFRNASGGPVAGRQLVFSISDEGGERHDLGTLLSPAGTTLGTAAVATTNSAGVAEVTYQAPPRTDANTDQIIIIGVRAVGTDASSAIYRGARIELRTPDPRLFPPNPDNALPTCQFAIEAPDGFQVNRTIIFDSTSFDTDGDIIRYEWNFGNGSTATSPDVATVYRTPGTFTVTHQVTDNNGGQAECFAFLGIAP